MAAQANTDTLPTSSEIRAAIGAGDRGTVRGYDVREIENMEHAYSGVPTTSGNPVLVARMPGARWTRIEGAA